MKPRRVVQLCSLCVMFLAALVRPEAARAEGNGMSSCYFCEAFIECPSDEFIRGYCYAKGCATTDPGCSGGPTPGCPGGLMLGCN